MNLSLLKDFLEEKYFQYNNTLFIESDPITIPHLFSDKEDIEIAAFLSATISWGQRQTIIRNANKLMNLMNCEPYNFLMNSSDNDQARFNNFIHRTFNGTDCSYFIKALAGIYKNYGGLEKIFSEAYRVDNSIKTAISIVRKEFFTWPHLPRTEKHFADPAKGSSAKRINLFLRWMVRSSLGGVDFGIWNSIPASALMIPLDIHTGNTSRILGLLNRSQNDWNAVEELTAKLRQFDPHDPVKYDFALFGLGMFEKFSMTDTNEKK
jgi:uncharacterized protein (TIGR02757 family)